MLFERTIVLLSLAVTNTGRETFSVVLLLTLFRNQAHSFYSNAPP